MHHSIWLRTWWCIFWYAEWTIFTVVWRHTRHCQWVWRRNAQTCLDDMQTVPQGKNILKRVNYLNTPTTNSSLWSFFGVIYVFTHFPNLCNVWKTLADSSVFFFYLNRGLYHYLTIHISIKNQNYPQLSYYSMHDGRGKPVFWLCKNKRQRLTYPKTIW